MKLPFINSTPTVELILRNPFTGRRYPERGELVAVIDTGYEGFLLIPEDVFDYLFEELETEKRKLILADKREVISRGTFGEILFESSVLDGFIETAGGVEEFVVGAEFLKNFMLWLDYCTRTLNMWMCR